MRARGEGWRLGPRSGANPIPLPCGLCSSEQSARARTQKELMMALRELKLRLPPERRGKGRSGTLATLQYALACVKQVQGEWCFLGGHWPGPGLLWWGNLLAKCPTALALQPTRNTTSSGAWRRVRLVPWTCPPTAWRSWSTLRPSTRFATRSAAAQLLHSDAPPSPLP